MYSVDWNELLLDIEALLEEVDNRRLEAEAESRQEARWGILWDYYFDFWDSYQYVFFVSREQFFNIPEVEALIYDDEEFGDLELTTVKLYEDEISSSVNQIRGENIKALLQILVDARLAASNLRGSNYYPDPSPGYIDSDDEDELAAEKPEFNEYRYDHHPYFYWITSEATCNFCKVSAKMVDFPFHDGGCCSDCDNFCAKNVVVDPRRINVLWKIFALLGWEESEVEDEEELDQIGERLICREPKCWKKQERMNGPKAVRFH